jgi:hypothetical protein
MEKNNPLSALLVSDSQSVDLQILADLLKDFVRINEASKEIDLMPAFRKLANQEKLMVYFAATKAAHILLKMEEKLTQKNLIDLDIMPEGSVKGTLKKLADDGFLKNEGAKYYLPSYRINLLADQLKHN